MQVIFTNVEDRGAILPSVQHILRKIDTRTREKLREIVNMNAFVDGLFEDTISGVRDGVLIPSDNSRRGRTMVGCTDAFTSVYSHTDIQKSFSRVTENLCRSS